MNGFKGHPTGTRNANNALYIKDSRMLLAHLGNGRTKCPDNFFFDKSLIDCFTLTEDEYINCDTVYPKYPKYWGWFQKEFQFIVYTYF